MRHLIDNFPANSGSAAALLLMIAVSVMSGGCDDSGGSQIADTEMQTDSSVDQDVVDDLPVDMDRVEDGEDTSDADADQSDADMGEDMTGGDPFTPSCVASSDLPVLHPSDPDSAARGQAYFVNGPLGEGVIPRLGIENLWLVWGGGPVTGDLYWSRFRERYGFHEAPFPNDGLPLGMKLDGGSVTFDCLMCHSGKVAGQIVIGAPNSRLDVEALYDDLVELNELAPQFGYPQFPVPFDLDGYTRAAGTVDGFGLTFDLAGVDTMGLDHDYGFQRSAGWWTARYKDRIYSDGIGQAGGHRTMMAGMIGFGVSLDEVQMMDEEFEDIAQMIYGLEAPCYPESIDLSAAERGQKVFDNQCATCHGVHSGPDASFPDTLVQTETVGTDAVREDGWTQEEATAVNSTWFGEPPMSETDGYLAQPLAGIWARAPYLHNGSVPDLAALLTPTDRPLRWRRTGSEAEDYDFNRVGWRYETVDTPGDPDTREGRLIYDTTLPALSNDGHYYGSTLTNEQKADLLEYLKTL